MELLCAAHLEALATKDAARANEMLNALRNAGGRDDSSASQRGWLSTALFDAHRALLREQPERALLLLAELGELAHGPGAGDEQRTQLAVALHNSCVVAEARGDERALQLLRAELALSRLASDTDVEVRAVVAGALRLSEWGRSEQSMKALDELIERCRGEADETQQEVLAVALINRAALLMMAGATRGAIQDLDELLARFNRAPGPQFRRQIAFALSNKGAALQLLNNEPGAAATLRELVARFARDPDPAIQNALATALENHSHPTPARHPPS